MGTGVRDFVRHNAVLEYGGKRLGNEATSKRSVESSTCETGSVYWPTGVSGTKIIEYAAPECEEGTS